MGGCSARTSATCGARRPMPARAGSSRAPPSRGFMPYPLRLRLPVAAHDLLARALRHVDPGILLVVALRGARAGRHLRLAIVLAGLHDPVALLVLELRNLGGARGRHERQREGGGDSGREQQLSVHHDLLFGVRWLDAVCGVVCPLDTAAGGSVRAVRTCTGPQPRVSNGWRYFPCPSAS